jgi:hypothetical protein
VGGGGSPRRDVVRRLHTPPAYRTTCDARRHFVSVSLPSDGPIEFALVGTAKGRAPLALAASGDGFRCTVPFEEPLLGASPRFRATDLMPTPLAIPRWRGLTRNRTDL